MRAAHFSSAVLLVFALSGCPVTDDYFIQNPAALGGSGATGGANDAAGTATGGGGSGGTSPLAGTNSGGSAAAAVAGSEPGGGSSAQAGADTGGATLALNGGAADAGAPAGGQPVDTGQAGAGGATCAPSTERCNGRDDDCDGVIDDMVCNTGSTNGCVGFALPDDPNHGYMLCSGQSANQTKASSVCAGQEMRLAWLESSQENDAVCAAITKLNDNATEVLFGASDQVKEGDWIWPGNGGFQFWKGNDKGQPVNGAFNAWDFGTPNDGNNGEDCGILYPETTKWGDRSCYSNWAFLCEDAN